MYMYSIIHDSSTIILYIEVFTFIHVCVDSSQTVLEHHRPFDLHTQQPNCTRAVQILHLIYISPLTTPDRATMVVIVQWRIQDS